MSTEWFPCGILNGKPATPYAVLILNHPLNHNVLTTVIEGAELLVCADGGANHLYKYDQMDKIGFKHRVPHAIVGDLDSLDPQVEQHYRNLGVEISRDPSQYATDFHKSLKWIREYMVKKSKSSSTDLDVVVLGGLGGRVDQGFSQIHHLYIANRNPQLLKGRIYLLSEQSLSFILNRGSNKIHIEDGYFEENNGVIPIMGPINVTMRGMEWDVTDWPTEFGGDMSTSNHTRSNLLEIDFDSDNLPLFTVELAKHLITTAD